MHAPPDRNPPLEKQIVLHRQRDLRAPHAQAGPWRATLPALLSIALIGCGTSSSPSIPPDPRTVAPPIDRNVPTTTYQATSFLYQGEQPIQTGVVANTIDPKRAALLRGKVTAKNGTPIVGATVTVLDHAEYGQTLTREDGVYDLVVNGGTTMAVEIEKEGFLTSQRTLDVPWKDYVAAPDIALVTPDPNASTIALAAPGMKIALGSTILDSTGSRRATLLFSPGTQATVPSNNGVENLSTLTVRLTDLTESPEMMPGTLPPTSAYTYAVDINVAEATGRTVTLSQPALLYVENFLGFAVGTGMPVGIYEKEDANWSGVPNGIVLKVLAPQNGLAGVDTNGDDQPDNDTQLAMHGITELERQTLAALYAPGVGLWRSKVPHFSAVDCNRPFRLPIDALVPGLLAPQPEGVEEGCNENGSIISCHNQGLGEDIPLAGTSLYLHYQSDRQVGRRTEYSTDITLSGETIPASLSSIKLEVRIAGQLFRQTFAAAPSQRYVFSWNGKDAFGRTLQGRQQARISVGYAYRPTYADPLLAGNQFASIPGVSVDVEPLPIAGREEITLFQHWTTELGTLDATPTGLGGFTLSDHHSYDPLGKTLYLGTGETMRSASLGQAEIRTVYANPPNSQYELIAAITPNPDGSYYAVLGRPSQFTTADPEGHRLIKLQLQSDGSYASTTIAGTLSSACDHAGDGGLASAANLCAREVVTGPDGSIYLVGAGRIRQISPDGIIRTIAGFRSNDGPGNADRLDGPPTNAEIGTPRGLVVDRDGAKYFAVGHQVIKLSVAGHLSRVAGNGPGYSGDGGPAALAQMINPWDIAIASDGSLLVAEQYRLRRIATSGIISTVAGGIPGFGGDGGPATEAKFQSLTSVALDANGAIYLADHLNGRIRLITPQGIIHTFAGTDAPKPDGASPTETHLHLPHDLSVGPDGAVNFLAQRTRHSFRGEANRVAPSLTDYSPWARMIPSKDGGLLYFFDEVGRHLTTGDATTGATLLRFGYTPAGQLATVTDADGNVTQIERDENGDPTAIIAPFGMRTALSLNSEGYLQTVTNPIGGSSSFTYHGGGLLSTFTDPLGGVHSFTYDLEGRLLTDTGPLQGTQRLTRSENPQEHKVTHSTPMGRATQYAIQRLANGAERWTNTHPDGTQTRVLRNRNGTGSATSPDGTITTYETASDPRFGVLRPFVSSVTMSTPGGLSQTIATERTAVVPVGADPAAPISTVEKITINGKRFTRTYNHANKTITVESPTGRQSVAVLNEKGRAVSASSATTLPTAIQYDARGRISRIAQGAREKVASYGPSGYLHSIADTLGRTTIFERDGLGRTSRLLAPNSDATSLSYNAMGDLVEVTPPSRSAHLIPRNLLGLLLSYTAPMVTPPSAAEVYEYNQDEQLTKLTSASGVVLDISYDPASGRETQLASPVGTTQLSYDSQGRLANISAPGSSALSFSYDGALLTGMVWNGPVAGSLSMRYDHDFRLAGQRVGAQPEIVNTYDNDGMLTGVGSLTISRNIASGRIQETLQSQVRETYVYNDLGELQYSAASCGSTGVRTATLSRDTTGLITGIAETLLGQSTASTFQFDANQRLSQVTVGPRTAAYTYDPQGNRLTATRSTTETYQYDAQDRLLRRGAVTYAYSPEGWLQTKTDGAAVSSYSYDLFGNLRSANLPNGDALTYVIDGAHQRVGKLRNGGMVQGFLYDARGRVVAELDAQGALTSQFVYGTRGHVPDYLIRGSTTYRILTDNVGSPRLIVNTQSCAIAQRIDYDEFGRVLADSSPGFQPFGFAGGLYDRDTGLVRFGARDYDPEAGRWTAKDPAGFDGGDTNLYAYVNNSPIQFVDPQGLSFWDSLTDFSAGFGDTITFGATRWVRKKLGVDDVVNPCSGWYTAGGVAADIVVTVATSGGGGGARAAAKRFCFVAGTEVHTPDGPREIQDLEPGDRVWSYDEDTKQVLDQKVTKTFITPEQAVLDLALLDSGGNREVFRVTGEHPFWKEGAGWSPAESLSAGDKIYRLSGGSLQVESVANVPKRETVYNLEVQGTHTYFVGDQGALVHNSCLERVVQTGGRTIKPATARAINEANDLQHLPREYGRALEALKKELGLDNDHHGKITNLGNYLDKAGNVLGSILP
jgi:RHS repeat-associated protein